MDRVPGDGLAMGWEPEGPGAAGSRAGDEGGEATVTGTPADPAQSSSGLNQVYIKCKQVEPHHALGTQAARHPTRKFKKTKNTVRFGPLNKSPHFKYKIVEECSHHSLW